MYRDLREVYWWQGMKKDIAKFVSDILIVNKRHGGLAQDI